MDEREKIIRLWFAMWLQQKDLGIDDIFAEDAIYIEEFGCNLNHYNPYQNSDMPQFRMEKVNWF